jgi:hypothetical protein
MPLMPLGFLALVAAALTAFGLGPMTFAAFATWSEHKVLAEALENEVFRNSMRFENS